MTAADIERIVAPNPGPMTLEGTNTYVVGRDPATVIDPGPADEGHIEKVRAAADARGGIGTVLLTHSHADHSDGVELLGIEPVTVSDAEAAGGLTALATPGHAPDHLCFLLSPGTLFCGDLVLGFGSAIVPTRELGGSLADYMASLRRLLELELDVMHPGHGPPIEDPEQKLRDYLAHREDRHARLTAAIERGERSKAALLAEVWDDVPEPLHGAAGIAMQAHLELLEDERKLPEDLVE